jgi:hypothetical protein
MFELNLLSGIIINTQRRNLSEVEMSQKTHSVCRVIPDGKLWIKVYRPSYCREKRQLIIPLFRNSDASMADIHDILIFTLLGHS